MTAPGLRPPDTLVTARLRLRPPVKEDAQTIFDTYARDLEVTRYTAFAPHRGIEDTRAFLDYCRGAREAGTGFCWVITVRDGTEAGRLLGTIELRPQGTRAEIGYVLVRAAWGRGLATEAAGVVVEWAIAQPGIHRVWAYCDRDNAASARVLEKVGMTREGLLRRWAVMPAQGETPRDCWCYARIREEGS